MARNAEKIKNKKAIIGVIGLGYGGLPLAVDAAKSGFFVIGFENDVKRVDKVNAGINYIGDILADEFTEVVKSDKLTSTINKAKLAECDVVLICVPTPLDKNREPEMSYIRSAEKDIEEFIHKDMLIIWESTTYPGTTEEELKVAFERSGLVCGKDFFLAFSPERVDPGNKSFKTFNIPKIVGGITNKCSEVAETYYKEILSCSIHRTSNSKVAEMTKLLENTYRNVNVALINEFAMLCERMNINVWEVIEAAKTKPFGFQPFYPGPGVGGHCIPLDPYYLSWKSAQYDFDFSMIKASIQINNNMPYYVINRINNLLQNKALNNSRVLICGIAYKADIDDYRESPVLEIIKRLECENAELHYCDPHITKFRIAEKIYETEKILYCYKEC